MNSLIPFIIASAVLLIIPGPAVIYIVTRSIDQGRFAGLVSVLGMLLTSFILEFESSLVKNLRKQQIFLRRNVIEIYFVKGYLLMH